MTHQPDTPFDNIESAHEFVDLLARSVIEARDDIDTEIVRAGSEGADRRKQALQLVAYKLRTLETHITRSRRILNDLRTLRRLLLRERGPAG